MTVKWTRADSDRARSEFWDVFYLDGDPGRPEIEYLSDSRSPWANDDDVLAYCLLMAALGSPLHAKALRLELSHNHGLSTGPYAGLPARALAE